ncbi:MAG: CoA transferase [Dehalococcoidales bacterium]|nr:CoA transferase [Dehalococcoidales bacterium]
MESKSRSGALSGITILAFCWAVVGPLTMKLFADHGATVIRVETSKRPCVMRTSSPYKDGKPGVNRGAYFNHFNTNILSLTLNMGHPGAMEIVKRLVAKSDVFMENYTPGNMEKWGLTYEELKKIKPDIIMLRQSGYGSSGPYSQLPAFGMVLSPIAGLNNFIGWPGKEPLPIGVSAYTDCISPRFAVATLIAALDHRNKTGQGQLLEVSQFETAQYFLLPAILDYAANHREPVRIGNASPYMVPHGIYRCKGEDRWCAIAVGTDDEWLSFCQVVGKIEYISDPRFDTLANRKKNEEELNALVSEWTVQFTAEEVMTRLQDAGVSAGVVKNTADIYEDPQLKQRNIFWKMDHAEMGQFTHLGGSFQLSATPSQSYSPSPLLGEHTEQICSEILGMPDDEFVQLMQDGVFE